MNILKTITERTRERIREQEKLIPPAEMRRMAEAVLREEQAGAAANSSGDRLEKDYMPAFERALRQPGMSFICEVKKASPSKGSLQRISLMWISQRIMRLRALRRSPV